MPGIPYPQFDLTTGIGYLRQLGVTYYLTQGEPAESAARAQPDLTLVGSTPQVQAWRISDAAIVAPLGNQPVVVSALPAGVTWQQYSLDYSLSPEWGQVVETRAGPPGWPRAQAGAVPPATALPAVEVSDVSVTDNAISFTVSRTGVPVVVRDTYFPGWQVRGGLGPYRAMPDFMVVVPTSRRVTLAYTTTAIITTADVLGGLGLLGVVALAIADRRRRRVVSLAAAREPAASGAVFGKARP
jgi:hypothetical protein